MYRYVDLRGKGLGFLAKHGYIKQFDYQKTGFSGFEGRFEVEIGDHGEMKKLLLALRAEQVRRNPLRVNADTQSALVRSLQVADSFHRVALRLRTRRGQRPPVTIADEYDVQYVLGGLLASSFDDVRPEEWTPSYAGGASRVDFLLKNEAIAIETKMT